MTPSISLRRFATLTVMVATVASGLYGATGLAQGDEEKSSAQEPSSDGGGEKRSSLREILESWIPGSDASADDEPEDDEEDAAGGMPSAMEGGAYSPSEVLSNQDISVALPWRPPDFSKQTGALGWSETAFDVPKGMQSRVNFWKDIYSKYTADQGVLHDSLHIDIVYAALDFNSIMSDPSLNIYQKARARERLVNDKRKEITERLKRLNGRKTADGLSGEDLRIWKMFERIKDPNKFLEATEKNRVRFQLGQRDKFILGIYYSGRYLRQMEKIFRDEGLPIELTRLPFVESSFNIKAQSRVGASGVWQFMPRTARPYMRVNRDVDERNDPLKATLASARVLKQNYSMLRAWPLAVTGYNHGAYGVRGIVNKLGTQDLAEIIEKYSSRTFGFASENFYACFLAALEVERNARKYFGDVKWSPEIESHELKVKRPVQFKSLLEFFDGDKDLASLLNPHLTHRIRSGKRSIPMGTFLRVPQARGQVADHFMRGRISPSKLQAALREVPIPKATPIPAVLTATTRPVVGEEAVKHSSLETLSAAAKAVLPALGAKPSQAASAAVASSTPVSSVPGVGSPDPIAATTPAPLVEPATESEASKIVAKPTPHARTHKVRRGESLFVIAKKYGIGVMALKKANGIGKGRKRSIIRAGQVLVIPSEAKAD